MKRPRKIDIAWAAGFIDGEGHFKFAKYTGRNGSTYGALALEVCQIDTRVLKRLKRSLGGVGKVYGPYGPYQGKSKTHSRSWKYITKGFGQCEHVIALLLPYLSAVKKNQAKAALRKALRHQHRPSQRKAFK